MEETQMVETEMEATLDMEEQLQSAVKLATQYKEENGTLLRELEQAREFSRTTTERNKEMRECWKKELQVVEKREKELERLESQHKQRLETRKAELEALERQYQVLADKSVPCNTGVVELENEYNTKVSRLEEEVTKFRDSYYESRQTSEQLKAKCERATAEVDRERATRGELQKVSTTFESNFFQVT
jgi:chromosome segregation ATPase